MQKKNQFKADSRYFTISIYTILTVLVICIIARAVFFWDSTLSVINNLLATMSPFLIGILIAFLINPLAASYRFRKVALCEEQCFGSFACHYLFLCFGYCFFGCGYYLYCSRNYR